MPRTSTFASLGVPALPENPSIAQRTLRLCQMRAHLASSRKRGVKGCFTYGPALHIAMLAEYKQEQAEYQVLTQEQDACPF